MVTQDVSIIVVGVAIMLAVPLTAMFANYIRKNVEHGEARFDTTERDTKNRDETDD